MHKQNSPTEIDAFLQHMRVCSLEEFHLKLQDPSISMGVWEDAVYVLGTRKDLEKMKALIGHLGRHWIQECNHPPLPTCDMTWLDVCQKAVQYAQHTHEPEVLGVLVEVLYEHPSQWALNALLSSLFDETYVLKTLQHPQFSAQGFTLIPEKEWLRQSSFDGLVWWGGRMSPKLEDYIKEHLTPQNQVHALLIGIYKTIQQGEDYRETNKKSVMFWEAISIDKPEGWWQGVDRCVRSLPRASQKTLQKDAPSFWAQYEKSLLLRVVQLHPHAPPSPKPKL